MTLSSAPLTLDKRGSSIPLFQGVEMDVMRELMSSAHTMQCAKGTLVLAQGAPISRIYILMDGWCGATKTSVEGQEAILHLFRLGDLLLDYSPDNFAETSPMSLQALTALQLLSLSPHALRVAVERSRRLADNIMAVTMRRCQDMRDHIEQLALHSAEQRVGRFLLQMRFNTNPEGTEIVLPFDKALIAAYLGIKPETFSRALQNFRSRGFTIDRNRLNAPFRQALCDYCDTVLLKDCPYGHSGTCPLLAQNPNPPV